jgi:hypothetical protein
MSNPVIESDTLLVPSEAAGYVRRPETTLRQWRYLGRGPRYVKVGHAIRYRRSDLDDWLTANTVEPLDA